MTRRHAEEDRRSPAGAAEASAHFEALVLSCEHASRAVPRRWSGVLPPSRVRRAGHCGYDRGAAALARSLARHLGAPLVVARATRLLVDCNRSVGHPGLWSPSIARLPADERNLILTRLHRPHRERVEQLVRRRLDRGRRTLHVSVHSFTPRLAGVTRNVDVGLLYDPRRPGERAFAAAWRTALRELLPDLIVRSNRPYEGRTDGLTTHLRGRLDSECYLGFELEINQRHVARPTGRRIGLAVAESLALLRSRRG